jgi:hypothetical protein
MVFLFWVSLLTVFYTFIGYGILLFVLVLIRRSIKGRRNISFTEDKFPTYTLIIASYNEADILYDKSHSVLRWTITPFLLILAFILNIFIVFETRTIFYELLLAGQFSFYLLAFSGWLMEQKSIRIKALFIPYYLCVMNYAVVAGISRYMFSEQKATWESAKRK